MQKEYVKHDPSCRRKLAAPRVRDDFVGKPKSEVSKNTQTGCIYINHGNVPKEKSFRPYMVYNVPTIDMDLQSTQRADYTG